MSDSTFAATIFLAFTLLSMATGACAAWVAMSGTTECSVMVSDATGNRAEYVTECEVMR